MCDSHTIVGKGIKEFGKFVKGIFTGGESDTIKIADRANEAGEKKIEEFQQNEIAKDKKEDLIDSSTGTETTNPDLLSASDKADLRDLQRKRKQSLSTGARGRRSTILTSLTDSQENALGDSAFKGKSILGR